jgi:hypothetical protein
MTSPHHTPTVCIALHRLVPLRCIISQPNNGLFSNVTFDNLKISFHPAKQQLPKPKLVLQFEIWLCDEGFGAMPHRSLLWNKVLATPTVQLGHFQTTEPIFTLEQKQTSKCLLNFKPWICRHGGFFQLNPRGCIPLGAIKRKQMLRFLSTT